MFRKYLKFSFQTYRDTTLKLLIDQLTVQTFYSIFKWDAKTKQTRKPKPEKVLMI